MEKKNYYLGLDIGTDSVGYAVTDEEYKLQKFHGEPMWGATVFEGGNGCAERRGFRSARRRLERKKQRIALLRELMEKEILKTDERFFIRLKESALYKEDRSDIKDANTIFHDENFKDKDYHKKYPTIHHLICDLTQSKDKKDIRLIYLACAWILSHRGHFLSEISDDNIDKLLDFSGIYDEFLQYFDENQIERPWEAEAEAFSEILKQQKGITAKEKDFYGLLFGGKKPKDKEDDTFNIACIIKLLCGGKAAPKDIFKNSEYAEVDSFALSDDDEKLGTIFSELGDDSQFVLALKKMFDWAVLSEVLQGAKSISKAKVAIYDIHKKDLKNLKAFIKKYCPDKYDEIFKKTEKSLKNYVAYSYNADHEDKKMLENGKASREDFSDYLKKIVKNIDCEECDREFYDDMINRLGMNLFLPKQKNTDNRVIPNQVYRKELKDILENAGRYYDFLKEKDEGGISTAEKILSVFDFKIPYFVGPLNNSSRFAWIKKKSEEKIYPWNFKNVVDFDKSEQAFIDRMTNTCTYLPDQSVLPKYSLCYCKYNVLNEINNIKIKGEGISVKCKQEIYEEVFGKYQKVTKKKICEFLKNKGYVDKNIAAEDITGIDITAKSSLKPYMDFTRLLREKLLSENEVEEIIERITYTEDKMRLRKWLKEHYSHLSGEDIKYICRLRYNDFGRLSRKLLCEIVCRDKETGEAGSIMEFLWSTNNNLMQLLSENFSFGEEIRKYTEEYYSAEKLSFDKKMDKMYIPNAVKRPIVRTFDIIKDVEKAMGNPPKKIFVEMARGGQPDEKGKRKASRKERLLELYKKIDGEDARNLEKIIEDMGVEADNRLQSQALYLYCVQLGRCMYSGKKIDLARLKTKDYDIDHIYPQALVKDDSILNNKVLVLSEYNGHKSDNYPIPLQWREQMHGYWKMLKDKGLITEEKYKRLTRNTPFSADEKWGFINRQLVETRQSTKAVATLLKEQYPDTEIVYVKAGLASDFRHEYELFKSREINDLHHAKDAYLNIVVGNVYHTRFTRKWFLKNAGNKYSIKTKTLFKNSVLCDGQEIWKGEQDIAFVKKTMGKNNIHFTRYAFMRKGGLFDQMPVKAKAGLVQRKKGLDTVKYGGYNKTTASFFALVKYKFGKKSDVMVMPVELLHSDKFLADKAFAQEYAKKTVGDIIKKKVDEVTFPLGERILKVNTVFELDGFRVCLAGKKGGGIGLTTLTPFVVDGNTETYIKHLEMFSKKIKENPNMVIDSEYDKISKEDNIKLYELYISKFDERIYKAMPCAVELPNKIKNGCEKFEKLSLIQQSYVLMQIQLIFKTCRSALSDLQLVGGDKFSGILNMSLKLSNWKKKYSDVRIIDTSASGLYEKKSDNLLKLL